MHVSPFLSGSGKGAVLIFLIGRGIWYCWKCLGNLSSLFYELGAKRELEKEAPKEILNWTGGFDSSPSPPTSFVIEGTWENSFCLSKGQHALHLAHLCTQTLFFIWAPQEFLWSQRDVEKLSHQLCGSSWTRVGVFHSSTLMWKPSCSECKETPSPTAFMAEWVL